MSICTDKCIETATFRKEGQMNSNEWMKFGLKGSTEPQDDNKIKLEASGIKTYASSIKRVLILISMYRGKRLRLLIQKNAIPTVKHVVGEFCWKCAWCTSENSQHHDEGEIFRNTEAKARYQTES